MRKVPKCDDCDYCRRSKHTGNAKTLRMCKLLDNKFMTGDEGRRSPKWCPLRPEFEVIK